MAIPSGSGTEVLKNGVIKTNSTWTYIRWDERITASGNASGTGTTAVPANCIITILNMTVNNTHSSALDFALRANVGSTDSVYIMNHAGTSIEPYKTFVFSDKFVLSPDNELQVYSSQNADIYFSYIYQDWT